ncbi:HlyD family efflux transporter periplasmic adaptor subunit [Phaeobacter sp. QD34_3]|uniref:efflux RND transporter periplasmic adaptor subunit n=1 Tax=unclassified Phaeobacter TaxID=2621772 RepID=UPI00237EF7C1|nr:MULTISPECIES: HlyD family efflux transporter periplasmic adaptor subunit [unclassified Phaeobacter]MDE4132753.1 HlyD family efflux transporter periplasmic adaptor subunit [Phaeobacter sp. QD34_3]MDE4136454.1 HlyD family efflux transporter periplasmic adaptor subunit [Phaeobacter sp. QD34_24]
MLRTRTVVMAGLVLLVTGTLGYVALRPEPVAVDLHEIARGPLQVTVNADGKTRIREIYDVSAPITGTAQRAPVRVGDVVVGGETVVAVLKPATANLLDARSRSQAEAAVREAEAGLAVARSQMRQASETLTLSESEFNRADTLVQRGVVSKTRLEELEQRLHIDRAAMTAAVSALEMAKGTLDRARAALIEPGAPEAGSACCLTVTAPMSGQVLTVDVLSEQTVLAGTRLISLGDPGDLEIVADLLSTDAVRLKEGDRAIVERWGGAQELGARVRRIEPAGYTKVSALGIEEQRVDVILDFTSPPEDYAGMGDGFAVFLRVVEWESDDVLSVPLSAVFRRGTDWAVFVEADGLAQRRRVSLGRRNDHMAEVLDGLAPGDAVILHPSDLISEGTLIEPRPDAL